MSMRGAAVLAMSALVLSIGLTACGGDNKTEGAGTGSGMPTVVASTDVWGSIAQRRRRRPRQGDVDRHQRRPPTRTPSRPAPPTPPPSPTPSLVVYNGGGYDHWVDDVLANHPGVAVGRRLLTAERRRPRGAQSGQRARLLRPRHRQGRRHDDRRPARAGRSRSRRRLPGQRRHLRPQRRRHRSRPRRAIGTTHPGAAVVATEPVAHYLLVATPGMTDKTPAGFSQRGRAGRRPRARRRGRHARPDQRPPGRRGGVQRADRDRGDQAGTGRRPERRGSHRRRSPRHCPTAATT